MASPKANGSSSPNVRSRANSTAPVEMDMSIFSWISNTHAVLRWPSTILSVAGLLVAGAFAEIAPRKSLEFLNNSLGTTLFFVCPLIFAIFLDWSTGLLAAVVSLVFFARLQKQDSTEGFSDSVDDTSEQSTKMISNPHRWFIERMLGERPVAISSDRIITSAVQDVNVRSSSSNQVGQSNQISQSNHSSNMVDSSSSSHK